MAIVANTGMISSGVGVGMSGLIISQLKDVSNDLTMTLDEESWFGKYLVHYPYTQLISIGIISQSSFNQNSIAN